MIADNLPVDNDSDNVSQDILSQMGLHSSLLNSTNYGFYEWVIPNNFTEGTSYTIKVSNVSDSSIFDESDNNFTILNNHSNNDID